MERLDFEGAENREPTDNTCLTYGSSCVLSSSHDSQPRRPLHFFFHAAASQSVPWVGEVVVAAGEAGGMEVGAAAAEAEATGGAAEGGAKEGVEGVEGGDEESAEGGEGRRGGGANGVLVVVETAPGEVSKEQGGVFRCM